MEGIREECIVSIIQIELIAFIQYNIELSNISFIGVQTREESGFALNKSQLRKKIFIRMSLKTIFGSFSLCHRYF